MSWQQDVWGKKTLSIVHMSFDERGTRNISTYRGCAHSSLLGGSRAIIPQPQLLKSPRAVLTERITIFLLQRGIDFATDYNRGGNCWKLAILTILGHVGKTFPFLLTIALLLFGIVLLFGVIMAAVIEELGVHLHEELHGIIYHTMNRAMPDVSWMVFS
jgi:hypothetical protein